MPNLTKEQIEEVMAHFQFSMDAIQGNPDRIGLPAVYFMSHFVEGVKKENYGKTPAERYKELNNMATGAMQSIAEKLGLEPHEAVAILGGLLDEALQAYYHLKYPEHFKEHDAAVTKAAAKNERDDATDHYIG